MCCCALFVEEESDLLMVAVATVLRLEAAAGV